MQFRLSEVDAKPFELHRALHEESVEYWVDNHAGGPTVDRQDIYEEAEWNIRPGELHSIRPQQTKLPHQRPKKPRANQSQVPSVNPTKKSGIDVGHSRKPGATLDLSPEPINYLKLRRTEQSKRATVRNRNAIASVIAHEIITPFAAPPPQAAAVTVPRQEFRMPNVSPPKRPVATTASAQLHLEKQHKGRVNDAQLDSAMQSISRQQEKTRLEAQQASLQLHTMLAEMRASSGASLYKFTPLFKLYARRRLRSRWRAWRAYVAWHAQEQERLETLAPFAVHIQRVFRFRSQRWARRRRFLEDLYLRWEASRTIQSCVRKWLRCRERELQLTVLHAARLQAAWRGRTVRKSMKRTLQTQLRLLLASISPTGDLHRLHEIARGDRSLAIKLNAMLVLVTETHVAVEVSRGQQRAPKSAAIAARNAARPVEATRKQLFHAVHELHQIVAKREHELQLAKEQFLEAKRVRREQKRQAHEAILKNEFAQTTERLSEARERDLMSCADLETREHIRNLRTQEEDLRIRQQLKRQRSEQEECALMLVEEYQMRYFVAETHRREIETRDRLLEVSRREEFLQNRAQQQLREMEILMRTNSEKQAEMERQRLLAHEKEKVRWARLSKAEQAEAAERLRRREWEEEEARQRLEDEQNVERAKARMLEREKEALRQQKYDEVERKRQERAVMEDADKFSRRWLFYQKKTAAAEQWAVRRERERTRYSLDPMQFAKMEAQKSLEERQRRENYLMRAEDVLSTAIEEKERKEKYFQQCREKKRLRDIERRREANETSLMRVEDEHEQERRRMIDQAEEYKRTLVEMQQLADQVATKQKDKLQEARNRKLMYDEETLQHRVEQAQLQFDGICEKRERQNMEEEDQKAQHLGALKARQEEKRIRKKRNLRMMREDVATMERQDWEDEGTRLEKLLWSPQEAAALRDVVTEYPAFLRTNVEVLLELADGLKGPPPLDLDYEAVAAHLATEHSLSYEMVPPKKRKLRRFFYHEFFEEDPIMARIQKKRELEMPPPNTGPGSTNQLTRERWKRVAAHFLGRSWASEASRKGFVLMQNQQYEAACSCLVEAVHGMGYSRQEDVSAPPTYEDVPPALLRQLGRCYLKQYEASAQREFLNKSLFFFQHVSTHVVFLSSPSFLQEIAFGLEQNGDYRHAAEVLGGIIMCFPRYDRLMEVIFRAGVVMFSLKMYRQCREYVLHTMDAAPFGWEAVDIVFLAARIMHHEGKSSRRLCEVAYEDAYRKNLKGIHSIYSTWQEWIKAPETWREAGDRYLEHREYTLAKDAFLAMRKRQTYKPSELSSKRRAVIAALRRQQSQQLVRSLMVDDGDWIRLGCTFAMLHDRETACTAVSNWLAIGGGYRARVAERFRQWPLVRWKLLTGAHAPTKVLQWLEDQRKTRAEAEALARSEREVKRQEVLRQRRERSKLVICAWEHEEEKVEKPNEETVRNDTTSSIKDVALDEVEAEHGDEAIVEVTGHQGQTDNPRIRSPQD